MPALASAGRMAGAHNSPKCDVIHHINYYFFLDLLSYLLVLLCINSFNPSPAIWQAKQTISSPSTRHARLRENVLYTTRPAICVSLVQPEARHLCAVHLVPSMASNTS
jgi:hypothetical protein